MEQPIKRKRVRNTKPGDVFSIPIDDTHVRYMQYVISDLRQMNSDVVRIFETIYQKTDVVELETIVSDNIYIYIHCCTRSGLKQELWTFVGNIQEVGDPQKILFQTFNDSPTTIFHFDNKYRVWHVNDERAIFLETLTEEQQRESYEGSIPPPFEIVQVAQGAKVWPYTASEPAAIPDSE